MTGEVGLLPALISQNALHWLVISTAVVGCITFIIAALRNRPQTLFFTLTLSITSLIVVSNGQDTAIHAWRSLYLFESLKAGNLDLLLTLDKTSLPVFYFYSPLTYELSWPFLWIGFTALQSTRLIASLGFILMAYSTRTMICRAIDPLAQDYKTASLLSVAFLSANYVYHNYLTRGALPEALSYALVSVIIVSLLDNKYFLSMLLIALQIMVHPVLFVQSFSAEAVILIMLDKRFFLKIWRIASVYGSAMVLSSPLWLFGLVNKASIDGIKGLPIKFEDTFVSLASIISLEDYRCVGIFILSIVLIMMINTHRVLTWQTILGIIAFTATLLIQLEPFKPWISSLPIINLSLFIWRWSFVSAIIGVTIIAVLWKKCTGRFIVHTLVILSAIPVYNVLEIRMTTANFFKPDPELHTGFKELFAKRDGYHTWGFGEFMPNYTTMPDGCKRVDKDHSQLVDYALLREKPMVVNGTVAIPIAPIGIVKYLRDGEQAQDLSVCDRQLLIPVNRPQTTIAAQEDFMMQNPLLRFALPVLVLLAIVAVLLTQRQPRHLTT